MIINEWGTPGIVIVLGFLAIMLMGAIVDIFQFMWVLQRIKGRRQRQIQSRIRAQILLELHEKKDKSSN